MDTRSAPRQPPAWLWFLGIGLLALLVVQQRRPEVRYDIRQVEVDEARALIELGALVIDVRGARAYEEEHIPGAISVPLDELEEDVPDDLAQSLAQPIVVYCGDGVTIGPKATSLLNQAGFAQAVNLRPGMSGWTGAGLAVERGAGS